MNVAVKAKFRSARLMATNEPISVSDDLDEVLTGPVYMKLSGGRAKDLDALGYFVDILI